MKRLDVKKLAAIGAGAALIGMALAPMAAALTKDEVLKTSGLPYDVVVGENAAKSDYLWACLLYTSPSPRDLSTSRMPSSA